MASIAIGRCSAPFVRVDLVCLSAPSPVGRMEPSYLIMLLQREISFVYIFPDGAGGAAGAAGVELEHEAGLFPPP